MREVGDTDPSRVDELISSPATKNYFMLNPKEISWKSQTNNIFTVENLLLIINFYHESSLKLSMQAHHN